VLPASVAQAFALPEKGYGSGPSGVDEGRILFQVDKVTPPEPLSEKDLERLNKQVGLLMSQDSIEQYSEALENRYGVTVNQQALAKLIGRDEEP
jgi:peptidyl-prolyl cis-trans isomerase D